MMNFDALPQPNPKRIALHVTPAAERALKQGHPWLFDQAIRQQSHSGALGDLAVIFDHQRKFLAIGLYDPDSPIRVKVLQHRQPATIDAAWFSQRIQQAIARRATLAESDTTGYRLIHGENDGLPALIVDRYADTLVLKLYSAAWLPHLADVIPALSEAHPHQRLVLRLSRRVADAFATNGLSDGQLLHGDPAPDAIPFRENGLTFAADVIHGQKTGFFFDQRDNRQQVRRLATGRTVLDVFAYSGGFSVYSAAGGAKSVTSVDVSAPALQDARANMQRNPFSDTRHDTIKGDAFAVFNDLVSQDQAFDLVIVDPPSFAKSVSEAARAKIAYRQLTRAALDVLVPDGILVMASCSSRVSAQDFFALVSQTAANHGRPLDILAQTQHALDHPIGFAEGAYLKCVFARVG